MVGEDLICLLDEGVGEPGASFCLWSAVRWLDRKGFEACSLGIGIRESVREAVRPEDGDGPVLFFVCYEDLGVVELYVLVQEVHKLCGLFGRDTAGASIGDFAVLV